MPHLHNNCKTNTFLEQSRQAVRNILCPVCPSTSDNVSLLQQQLCNCPACRMLLPWQQKGWTFDLKVHVSMNLQFKNIRRKSLQQNWRHLSLVLYCTNQSNIRLYAFLSSPTDCKLTHLPQHQDKPALPPHLNFITRLKTQQHLRKYDMYSQLQILYHRVSTYNRSYLKRINLEYDNEQGRHCTWNIRRCVDATIVAVENH